MLTRLNIKYTYNLLLPKLHQALTVIAYPETVGRVGLLEKKHLQWKTVKKTTPCEKYKQRQTCICTNHPGKILDLWENVILTV